MKLIFSENIPSYTQYLFPYSVYGIKSDSDKLAKVYEKGFLPTRVDQKLFYLARSTRIDLAQYNQNSELRRISRKVEGVTIKIQPLSEFTYDFTIGKQMKDFYDIKFGEKTMSAQKAKWLFTSGAFTHVLTYYIAGLESAIGFCVINFDNEIMHYAYPFYDLDLDLQNLGLGMMMMAIELAQKSGCKYTYLGTTYTENSLYKTQFPGFSWFDGIGWNNDLKRLKSSIREIPESNPFMQMEDRIVQGENSQIEIDLN